jgi:16S rRNA (uracil1498-N3)-methyltransferase
MRFRHHRYPNASGLKACAASTKMVDEYWLIAGRPSELPTMSDRFFSPCPITAERVTLDGPEAHHLLHVMRAKAGQRITLFDGSGAEFDAEIVKCNRADVEVRVDARRDVDRELKFALVVGVSLPKGDRQKWLVEKLTELGVAVVVPLETERGIAQPTDSALERLERSVIEAAKQCGRNRLMRIAKPQALSDWVRIEKDASSTSRLIAHPNGAPIATLDLAALPSTRIAIGPEGGFTDAEVASAVATGWQSVDLGKRILRVETAAVALAAVVALAARS